VACVGEDLLDGRLDMLGGGNRLGLGALYAGYRSSDRSCSPR
jgi:hypothetical protein